MIFGDSPLFYHCLQILSECPELVDHENVVDSL